jgi:hypothetical protein
MNPKFGRRTWVKLWINDWLEGTTRYQMTDAQRAFWIDLLAMAGRSRFGGIVCSGKDGNQLIGYPLSKFQGLLAEPIDIEETFALFQHTGKITIQTSGEGARKLYVLFISNWERYQSEYDRTKKYRTGRATPNATDLLHQKSQPCYAKSNTTEVEVDVEVEKHIRPSDVANPAGPRDGGSFKTNPENLQTVTEIYTYYLQTLGKNPKVNSFTEKRRKKVLARLGDALETTGGDLAKAKGLLCVAVDTLAASPFHRGANDQKQKYDSLEDNLFKSREQFEKWLQRSIDGEGAE